MTKTKKFRALEKSRALSFYYFVKEILFMKAINKNDLIIVLKAIKDRSTLDLDDLETILDRFGDEYFVEDGEFVKTTENQEMAAFRGCY